MMQAVVKVDSQFSWGVSSWILTLACGHVVKCSKVHVTRAEFKPAPKRKKCRECERVKQP